MSCGVKYEDSKEIWEESVCSRIEGLKIKKILTLKTKRKGKKFEFEEHEKLLFRFWMFLKLEHVRLGDVME